MSEVSGEVKVIPRPYEEKAYAYADRQAEIYRGLKEPSGGYANVVDAYIAGSIENGMQWHKATDGDLPNNVRYVWTNVGSGYHDDDGWWDAYGRLQGVVAWCEPKFEEETNNGVQM